MIRSGVCLVLLAIGGCGNGGNDGFCPPGTRHVRPAANRPYEFCKDAAGAYEGPYRHWRDRARPPVEEGAYHFNKRQGPWTTRWDNGQPKQLGSYQQDVPVGAWHEHDDRGREIHRYVFDIEGRPHGLELRWRDGAFDEAQCDEHGRFVWKMRAADAGASQAAAEARPCP